jgi:hypothetical protein
MCIMCKTYTNYKDLANTSERLFRIVEMAQGGAFEAPTFGVSSRRS